MTELTIREMIYDSVCSKKGHKFIKECKVKNCCKSVGRHSHDGVLFVIPVRNNKLQCANCGEPQK
jgi:hypothetical protein